MGGRTWWLGGRVSEWFAAYCVTMGIAIALVFHYQHRASEWRAVWRIVCDCFYGCTGSF